MAKPVTEQIMEKFANSVKSDKLFKGLVDDLINEIGKKSIKSTKIRNILEKQDENR